MINDSLTLFQWLNAEIKPNDLTINKNEVRQFIKKLINRKLNNKKQ